MLKNGRGKRELDRETGTLAHARSRPHHNIDQLISLKSRHSILLDQQPHLFIYVHFSHLPSLESSLLPRNLDTPLHHLDPTQAREALREIRDIVLLLLSAHIRSRDRPARTTSRIRTRFRGRCRGKVRSRSRTGVDAV